RRSREICGGRPVYRRRSLSKGRNYPLAEGLLGVRAHHDARSVHAGLRALSARRGAPRLSWPQPLSHNQFRESRIDGPGWISVACAATIRAFNANDRADMGELGIGKSVVRFEDARFVRGKGQYVDDLTLTNIAHGVVLRSQHAHAKIRALHVDAARAAPGVLAVLTAADIKA